MSSSLQPNSRIDYRHYLPFWDVLTEAQKEMIRALPVEHCRDGRRIRIKMEDRNGGIFVFDGMIRVYMFSRSGREFTLYNAVKGTAAPILPFDSSKHPMLSVVGDSTFVLVPISVVSELLRNVPESVDFILNTVTGNVQEVVDNIESAFFTPLTASIARILLRRSSEEQPKVRITHEGIANQIGTTREMVTREIRRLREEGLIENGRGSITILDREALQACVDHPFNAEGE